jgi:hypothetical protein
LAQVFIVIGPLRAEQMRRARVSDEIIAGRAYNGVPASRIWIERASFDARSPCVLFLHE